MKSLGVCYWYVKVPRCECVEHWLEYNYVLCLKTYSTFGGLFWFSTGSRRAAKGTRICETPLLFDHRPGWIFLK